MTGVVGALLGWASGSRFALALGKWLAILLTVILFLFSFRRTAQRAGRLAQRIDNQERRYEIQRRMLEASARRPRNRDQLAQRLRDGGF